MATVALAEAKRLKTIMEKWGVRCSVELQAGRKGLWMVTKYLRVWHHTVSRYTAGGNKTPVLSLVKNGRSDVPGPLANGYLGYDNVFRIITMGLANHPGKGGPVTIDGVHIPRDSARAPTFGIEVEGGYQRWEDIPGMLETMGRADNALAEWSGRPLTSQLEHLTWAPTRKIDRLDFTRTRGISLTRQWSKATGTPSPKEGFLMGLSDKQQDEMYEWLNELRLGRQHKEFGRDWNRDNLLPPLQELLGRHGSILVTASDRESGDPVYLTDFMTKTLVPHNGPLHQALRWFAGVEGRDQDAVRIDRDVLDEIPTIEAE